MKDRHQLSQMQDLGIPGLEPEIRLNDPRPDGRTYAVTVRDPRTSKKWSFHEIAGLVARLDQREVFADALRQIVWLADAEQPLSVKAGQIAADALNVAEETGF